MAPLTSTYLGIEDIPIGVRLSGYDVSNCIENGVLYNVDYSLWKK